MRGNFVKRTFGRRIVALVAAYAIALSSLLATFGAARAAAEATTVPGGIICHTLALDTQSPSPSGGRDNGKICADCCGAGCLIAMAALPPPPAQATGAPQTAGQVLQPPATLVLAAGPTAKSHRSRAPPLTP